MNGAGDHSRKSSVTISANGPNGGAPPASGQGSKSGIQFGFNESPAIAHSTPQASAAPIPIPGDATNPNQRVPSPSHSPSPIPQNRATSGGRPPPGMAQANAQMTFGSLGSDGDRHMRQGSVPQNPAALASQPGAHIRRESAVSAHSDMSAGPGPSGPNAGANRPNFNPQAGRGRGNPGFNPQHAPYNNNNMGFPPNYRPNNAGRGGPHMPPAFQPGRPVSGYPNSPGPGRSPALAHSQPGTPNMNPAQMHHPMPMQTPPQHYYQAPPPNMQHQQVPHLPFSYSDSNSKRSGKKKNPGSGRRHTEQIPPNAIQSTRFSDKPAHPNMAKPRRPSRRGGDLRSDNESPRPTHHCADTVGSRPNDSKQAQLPGLRPSPFPIPSRDNSLPPHLSLPPPSYAHIDLSPESGGFERALTRTQYGYPPYGGQFDPRQAQGYVPQAYIGQGPGGSPATNFQQPFVPPQYHTPAPPSMSRTSSLSERPPSSTGQPAQGHQGGPVVVSGSQPQNGQKQPSNASTKGAKKSSAIPIKNPAGELIDVSSFKNPSSPSPTTQSSKTPPVASSTPPPSGKPATPATSTHSRAESQSTSKTAKQIQDELRAKIMKAAKNGGDETKAKEELEKAEAETAEEEKESGESKPAAEPEQEEQSVEPGKAEPEPAKKETADKPAESAPAAEDEEDELERQIREMEEAELRREQEAAEYEAKKKARQEEEKKQAEAKKAANADEEDKKLRDAEREAERLEEEKEKKRAEAEAAGVSVADLLAGQSAAAKSTGTAKVNDVTDKLSNLDIGDKPTESKPLPLEKQRGAKPPALNLAPLNTKPVEPPQPSAALQSLKSARFLDVMKQDMYPDGIRSPNPAVNAAVAKKGKAFKYDAQFLLQFQKVFTEQPSIEFHQQVKSLIGENDGSRSASTPRTSSGRNLSRNNSFQPNQQSSNMGQFGRDARGTTSAERFAMSNAAMQNKAPAAGGMGSFGRPGSFPMGAPMSRNPSTANAAPNSPRTGSHRGRGSSRRVDHSGAKEAQAAKTMPLTAGQELKPIAVTSTGWKPRSLAAKSGGPAAAPDHLDPETVQRKVKANLNKMTPEKFEKIADQIQAISSQSKNESDGRTLRQVIQLTFEKATDEAHWASMYAKFCRRMLDTMSTEIRDENLKDKNGEVVSGGALFRKYLLNRCQEEFERGWKMDLPEAPKEGEGDKKPQGEAAMLSDEYYIAAAAKRRGLGLVQFIGELYKLGMLTERIMHACVQKLLDYETTPEEAEIESLCKLLRTIGPNLDASPRGKGVMDAYFSRIQLVVDMPDLQSRLKFMLMDVVDMRKAGWVTKEANKGPKTLEEVRAEAEAAAALKAQENSRNNQRGGGPPGGRAAMGRGDARHMNYHQQNSNQVGMDDLRRLKGATSRAASGNVSLGPTSMFSSRSNSGRRLGGPGGSLGRTGGDSGNSSRTGTPPTTNTNAFSALANLEDRPTSPPNQHSELSKQESAPRPAESAQQTSGDKADKS